MGIIDTQKHRKKIIGQTCVCLCCDDPYLRILGVFLLKIWYQFYKGDLATKIANLTDIFVCCETRT